MEIPASTYRLQLSPEFSFEDLQRILDYLVRFQVSTIYSAPFFQSREGSTHGYDVVDPFIINKAIGDLEQFREISHFLKLNKMNWLQDIVPNHMAFHPSNPWIYSILEEGPRSQFYQFFDINWEYVVIFFLLLGLTNDSVLLNAFSISSFNLFSSSFLPRYLFQPQFFTTVYISSRDKPDSTNKHSNSHRVSDLSLR